MVKTLVIFPADEQADQTLEEEKEPETEGADGEEQPKSPEIGRVHPYLFKPKVNVHNHPA